MSTKQQATKRQGEKPLARLQQVQHCFTQHLRDPAHNPAPPGIEDRRMAIYRGLIYRNIEGLIADGFPVLRSITSDAAWHQMVRDFIITHAARTPYFPKLGQEFLHYLESERKADDDPPFIQELAHYEWVESAIIFDNRVVPETGFTPDGDLLAGVPLLNPLHILLAYQWPVHTISARHIPVAPAATYLLVYRNKDDKHGFIELNPVSAKLITYLQQNESQSGYMLLKKVAEELQHPNHEAVIKGGLATLQTLMQKTIILGVRCEERHPHATN